MESGDLVSVQLVLNLQCLGFDVQQVVHKRVPVRGLPQRYASFSLSAEMFEGSNSAAAEVVLFFLFEAMPWEAVADVLPHSTGLSPDQARLVRNRLVETARHHLAELTLCFPCVEVEQLTAFKKQASALLELVKHMLPPEIGHARRLVTEAGPRMAWVCLRLSSYLLQYEAIGRIDPIALSGAPHTEAHGRVLKAQVVRETLRFQQCAAEFLEAEVAVKEAARSIAADYEAARGRIAAVDAARTRGGGAGGSEGTSATLQRRKQLLAEIDALSSQQQGVEEALHSETRPELTRESLEKTWRESGGNGALADRIGSHGVAVDLTELSRQWVHALEGMHPERKPDARRAVSSTKVSDLIQSCDVQMEPLTALLSKLKTHNADIEEDLRPRLQADLSAFQRQVAEASIDALLSFDRAGSCSPVPLPLHSCPLPTLSTGTPNPDSWLYERTEY